MASEQEKKERFKRIAENRTNKIIDLIRLLGNCSNTSNYSYTDEEVDYLLYYNAKIISRCESYNTMRKLEKYFTSQYHDLEFWGDILDKPYILLSKKDSNLKEVRTGAFKLLKVK